ncbi:sensor histidine kinase [Devosia nitrariae]|uniref:histidine kinase n=1 Tax=Devosia nitrariae TaxID=2071872 RepID=A0ABQ5W590_9HYPH|nr:ATP-binding protein [Devosia nitrariae]GLQ54956.1 sensor protein CutS [Devosia nitrariae]
MKILGFPWTIRTRLTLLYAGAFLLAGVALIAFIYLFLGQVLEQQFMIRTAPGAPPLEETPGALDQTRRVVDIMIRRARVDTLQTMLIASGVFVAVLTIAAGIIGWLVAGQALQPLRNITLTARRVADRSLHERIALAGPNDEIKDLADTLDAMLERLDRAFDSQRRFVANASHELRTPLTITRTLIEVALMEAKANASVRQLGTTLLAVNERHERLIDGLLTLAGSEEGAAGRHPLDLCEVAAHVVNEQVTIADKVGVRLDADVRPAPMLGDGFLLERLVQNLVENAIQYNLAEGGWVRIATGMEDGQATLRVENSGPQVPSYEIASLFEPFRRLKSSERLAEPGRRAITRGAGLGLSIVRSVARTHGGEVEAVARTEGGLAVTVRLPAAGDVGDDVISPGT